jgi:hypothetical protein
VPERVSPEAKFVGGQGRVEARLSDSVDSSPSWSRVEVREVEAGEADGGDEQHLVLRVDAARRVNDRVRQVCVEGSSRRVLRERSMLSATRPTTVTSQASRLMCAVSACRRQLPTGTFGDREKRRRPGRQTGDYRRPTNVTDPDDSAVETVSFQQPASGRSMIDG